MEKACRKCGIVKPLDEFHRANNTPDKRQYRCKPCSISAARQYAKDHPESKRAADAKYGKSEKCKAKRKARRADPVTGSRIKEQKRAAYYRNHDAELEKRRAVWADPEFRAKARQRMAKWQANDPRGPLRLQLKMNYSITLDDYDAMVIRQQGRCDICSAILDKPNVDHCHASGKIRALLCGHCNRGLGYFRDKPEVLRLAAEYLEVHASA